MGISILYLILIFALFVLFFLAKRRFGLIGLALASGVLLADIWGYDAGLIASGMGFPSNKYVDAIVKSIIILLPAVILLFHSYKCKTLAGRISGSFFFATFAFVLLLGPLAYAWNPSGLGSSVVNMLGDTKNFIISLSLIFSVVDLSLTKLNDNLKRRR